MCVQAKKKETKCHGRKSPKTKVRYCTHVKKSVYEGLQQTLQKEVCVVENKSKKYVLV